MMTVVITISVLIGALSYLYEGKNIYFGVRLPIACIITEEMKKVKSKYIMRSILLTIVVFIVSIIFEYIVKSPYAIGILILMIFLSIAGIGYLFSLGNKEIKKIKDREKWTGYTKDIVVVDINYRKKENIKVAPRFIWFFPIFIFISNLLLSIYSYKVSNTTISKMDTIVIPNVINLFLLVIMIITYKMIVKAKATINGGDVEGIKRFNYRSRYYLSFIPPITAIVVMTMELFITKLMYNNYSIFAYAVVVGISILCIITMTLILLLNITKERESICDVGDVINRDDDKFYKWGLIYYNPYDPTVWVKERNGLGVTINLGNKKGKIVSLIMTIPIVCVLLFTAIVLPINMTNKNIYYSNNDISIDTLYGIDINKDDIENILIIEKKDMGKSIVRTNGSSISNMHLGNYSVDGVFAKMYIEDDRKKIIEIDFKNKTKVFINYKDESKTIDEFNKIQEYIKEHK